MPIFPHVTKGQEKNVIWNFSWSRSVVWRCMEILNIKHGPKTVVLSVEHIHVLVLDSECLKWTLLAIEDYCYPPFVYVVHSKVHNLMLVVIKVHVILRSFVVWTRMLDRREIV